jgi:adenine-specific DNA-methyltransferase
METLKMQSKNIVDQNVEKIRKIFPNAVVETKDKETGELKYDIDFDTLHQELSKSLIEGTQERYQLNWPEKRNAILNANSPTDKTLRPQLDKSSDFFDSQNIYIEGDNLEALKIMRETYLGKVKIIYIDPPYNTGSDFVYKDSFSSTNEEYLNAQGGFDENGNKLFVNNDSSGRFHTDWLNMIFPRIALARDFLTDDGVIFISIDDNELNNLITVCNEIFGENNHVSTLIWNKQHSQQQGIFKRYHESVLVYAKDISNLDNIKGGEGIIEAGAQKKISKSNPESTFDFPAGVRFDAKDGVIITGTYGDSEKSTVVSGRLICKEGKTLEPVTISAGWTQKNQMKDFFSGKEVFDSKGQKVTSFFFNSAGKLKCTKDRTKITPSSILPEYGMVSEQTGALARLMGGAFFDNPKPVKMIEDFVSWFADSGDIVMDFFSGSGTTGQSVMEYCASSNIDVHFMLVQIPQKIEETQPAWKAGYRTICDLGEERLRRSAAQIKEKSPLFSSSCDLGFRVFSIDSTNMKDVFYHPADFNASLLEDENTAIKSGRSSLDLLFQAMLELGITLDASIESKSLGEIQYYAVNGNDLIGCFDGKVGDNEAEGLAKLSPLTVVFRDDSFINDSASVNCEQIFKTISPRTKIKVI